MKHFLLKTMLLLCALVVGSSASGGTKYVKVTSASDLVANGEYLLVSGTEAYSGVSSNIGQHVTVTFTGDDITNISTAHVLRLGGSTGAWTFYDVSDSKYLAYTSTSTSKNNNLFQVASSSANGATWTLTASSSAVKIQNNYNDGRWMRYNSDRFCCYYKSGSESTTGSEVTLYKKQVDGVTSLSVKTAPTKTAYKITENLDMTGLVLDADGADVTSGYTMKIGETAINNGDALNTAGSKTITITYGGTTCNQIISVGELSSISYNVGTFAYTTYTEKDFFNPDGLVVTAHYSNSLDEIVSSGDYTLTPSTSTALQTTDDNVEVSFTWNSVEKTINIPITVNAGMKYTVSFDAGNGTYTGGDKTETEYKGGVTLPAATCTKSGWEFAGWATVSVANTSNRPTLYLSGEKFYPTAATTLYAVYTLEGVDGTKYMRAKKLSEVTSASNIIVVNNSKAIDDALGSVNAPTETEGLITPSDNIVWSLSGNNTDGFTLTTTSLTTNKKLGITNIPSNYGNVLLTNDNSRWIIETHTGGENLFVLKNKTNPSDNTKVGVLEYTSSKWKYYCISANTYKTTNDYSKSKLYIPVPTVYNSNPTADIIQPTVEFEKDNTTLYLDGTTTYSNAASVTGVTKSVTGYQSSDEDVVTVAADGTITAIGIGTATITAYLDAELGVHKAAQATYNVVVKSTTTIAGIKGITDAASAVDFTADLSNAVVTYVDATGKYAYIQDASAAIMVYVSGGHGLTAGQKINGAVSGQVKAPNQIDQISSIDVDDATVTNDGVIPNAEVKTIAQIVADAAILDGKKVLVNSATVKTGMTNATSGGVITDDGEVTTINIIAPNNLTLKATEIGNFTGFVSTYISGNNTTYRLNLYASDQYQKTQNVALDQSLSFESNAVELDEETEAYDNFTGQAVSGAQGTVTYTKTDENNVISSLNAETGSITLTGTCGTATITATAAATEITEGGVTTPYNETTKTYTITVRPRYTVTFHINGVKTELREESYGDGITVPTLALDGYSFKGWRTAALTTTDTDPDDYVDLAATIHPADYDDEYYAVYAKATATGTSGSYTLDVSAESDLNVDNAYGSTINYTATDGSDWAITAYIQKNNTYGLQINTGKTAYIQVPSCPGPITTIAVSAKSGSNKAVGFSTTSSGSSIADGTNSTSQTLNLNGKNVTDGYIIPVGGTCIITKIVVNYGPEITYSGYTTEKITGVENRTMATGKIGTICLPYAVKAADIEGATVYTVAGKTLDGEGNLQYITISELEGDMVAGTPYIFKATADAQSFTFVPTNKADAAGSANGLVGSFTETEITKNVGNYIFSGGLLYLVDSDDVWVGANRAYIHLEDVPANASSVKGINIFADGVDPTAISAPFTTVQSGVYYNLQGQRVENPTHGIYIINGKKVFIK